MSDSHVYLLGHAYSPGHVNLLGHLMMEQQFLFLPFIVSSNS